MSKITEYLNKIKTAKYGKDVRSSIYNAIKQCYADANSATLRETAFNNAVRSAVTAGILGENTYVTYRMDSLGKTSFYDCLDNGTYTWTSAWSSNITDMPLNATGTNVMGLLITCKATASSVLQFLIITSGIPSLYARRIGTDSNGNPTEIMTHGEWSWYSLGSYADMVDYLRNSVSDLALFESANKGVYNFTITDVNPTTWKNNGGPLVYDSGNNLVALCPGTFVSGNPLYPYGGPQRFTSSGEHSWTDHYYGVETTTNKAYHFIRRSKATVNADTGSVFITRITNPYDSVNGENGWYRVDANNEITCGIVASNIVRAHVINATVPYGKYHIQEASIDANDWKNNGGPLVFDSNNNLAALLPGTLVSENPFSESNPPSNFTDGTYAWSQHYYGIEATTGKAYHFLRRCRTTIENGTITSSLVLPNANDVINGTNGWFTV